MTTTERKAKALAVKKIYQQDAHHFVIEWTNGISQQFKLSELQRACCCASCVDEATGQPLLDPKSVDEQVEAKRLMSVGRYALRVDFTSGCSNGIFTYTMLRELGEECGQG